MTTPETHPADPADPIGRAAGLTAADDERLRGHRPEVAAAAWDADRALFPAGPDEAPGLDRATRLLLAARAAVLDGAEELAAGYRGRLAAGEPPAGLFAEDLAGLIDLGPDGPEGAAAPRRLRAALRHTELLVRRPAASTAGDLAALVAAGWGTAEIVVLSQVVAFVTAQARVSQGLRVLAGVTR